MSDRDRDREHRHNNPDADDHAGDDTGTVIDEFGLPAAGTPTSSPTPRDPYAVDDPALMPNYVNISDEEAARPNTVLRVGFWTLSVVVLAVFIALPLLRIAIWADDDTSQPGDAVRDARGFVATQFTHDALEARSVSAAQRWVQPDVEPTVEEIVGRLQATSPALMVDSRAAFARATCRHAVPDHAECFQAWLAQPGQPELIRVEVVIGIVDGSATVIGLESIGTI
jgi:hypothetical protein